MPATGSRTTTTVKKNKASALSRTDAPVRVGMLSLGCAKTLVDSEVILGKLGGAEYELVPTVSDCDVALLNTCAFIGDAQKESVDRILQLIQLKKEKRVKAVVVMGCLVQRFPDELQKDLKEVDAFIGSGEYAKIPEIVERVSGGRKVVSVGNPGYLVTSKDKRVALTPDYSRYVKVSEGCDHVCTFCTIPTFRGKHRSRTIGDVETEVRTLTALGAREIILTGQDTTFFGRDHSGEFLLPELIRRLDRVEGVEWLRLLYAYPACVTKELMETMRDSRKMVHYLDMPLQHASDAMLTSMRRGITKRRTGDLLKQFRSIVPDLAIRTTFIVGFPGETDKDFEELLGFMAEMRFERVGIFRYSQEEGSPAGQMKNQIPERVKQERFEEAMKLQKKISREFHRSQIGKTLRVLIEGPLADKKQTWKGRSYMDAPDVDGSVQVVSAQPLQPGAFHEVLITASTDYDLLGKL